MCWWILLSWTHFKKHLHWWHRCTVHWGVSWCKLIFQIFRLFKKALWLVYMFIIFELIVFCIAWNICWVILWHEVMAIASNKRLDCCRSLHLIILLFWSGLLQRLQKRMLCCLCGLHLWSALDNSVLYARAICSAFMLKICDKCTYYWLYFWRLLRNGTGIKLKLFCHSNSFQDTEEKCWVKGMLKCSIKSNWQL